jgi:hypothetical protein
MKKASRPKRPSKNGSKAEDGPVRGPGTLTRRIANLKARLKPEQVQRAERLLKTEEYRVVKLAWYMHSRNRAEERKARTVAKYREGLRKLLGPDAADEI